jgi:hypothetical protein
VVFSSKEDFDEACQMDPPFGEAVPTEEYDPTSLDDHFFRTFLAFNLKPSYIGFEDNIAAELQRLTLASPDSVGINVKSSCGVVYWEKSDPWLASHNNPGKLIRFNYTARQISSTSASPFVLRTRCPDWKRFVLIAAADRLADGMPFAISFPRDPSLLSAHQKANMDGFYSMFGRSFCNWVHNNQVELSNLNSDEGTLFFPGINAPPQPWHQVPELSFFKASARNPHPLLPLLTLKSKQDLPPNCPLLEVHNISWSSLYLRFEKEHAERIGEPLHYAHVRPNFAFCRHPDWIKLFVKNIGSSTEQSLRFVLTSSFDFVKIVGIQHDRETGVGMGYGFLYVQGAANANTLCAAKYVLNANNQPLAFEIAKPKEKQPNSNNQATPAPRRRGAAPA